ncbi:MAG TPA: MBL fold metallo-hydrolase [Armatimonadetes bacterium]|nr:MBL fold metallo-hydrolase [Armatimonadota bacterium]
MHIETFVAGPLANNVYLLVDWEAQQAAIVDPGLGSRVVWDYVQREGLTLTAILNTHGHFDHVAENAFFKRVSGAPLYLHAEDEPLAVQAASAARWFGLRVSDSPPPDHYWQDGDQFSLGTMTLIVRHTPGHSPGGVCLLAEGLAFVGDTLFAGSIGRTDLPGGNYTTLLDSIRRVLLPLPDDTVLYPGHGPTSTIGRERQFNPYLCP